MLTPMEHNTSITPNGACRRMTAERRLRARNSLCERRTRYTLGCLDALGYLTDTRTITHSPRNLLPIHTFVFNFPIQPALPRAGFSLASYHDCRNGKTSLEAARGRYVGQRRTPTYRKDRDESSYRCHDAVLQTSHRPVFHRDACSTCSGASIRRPSASVSVRKAREAAAGIPGPPYGKRCRACEGYPCDAI